MTQITLDEAARRTLRDVVGQACANRETIVVTGPQGEVARIVPVAPPPTIPTGRHWKGRPIHDAEELARMTPEELKSIGWNLPDESAWVDEIADTRHPEAGKRD